MEENRKNQEETDKEQNCETVRQLFAFITASPSPFHAVKNMRQRLEAEGYQQLLESRSWELQEGGRYYVTRNGS